jgi:transposase
MGKRSNLSPAQRTEAVLSLLRREEPATTIARRYGVSDKTLYNWRDEFLAAGKAQFGAKTKNDGNDRRLKELERRLEKRDQVIGELTVANRILKKLSAESGLPPPSEDW